jgi:hypothetical protein
MFKIFVVFHKQLFDECYADIPPNIIRDNFVFVAVNPSIEKIYTPNKYNIINEWELSDYNHLDNYIYRENSVIYNVFNHKLYGSAKYVGFAQYDMKFTAESLLGIHEKLNDRSYVALWPNSLDFCKNTSWEGHAIMTYITELYEHYFNKKIDSAAMLPLVNTYILPTASFETIMEWVVTTYDNIIKKCLSYPVYRANYPIGLASIYERVMALAVGNSGLECYTFNLIHDELYKQQCY